MTEVFTPSPWGPWSPGQAALACIEATPGAEALFESPDYKPAWSAYGVSEPQPRFIVASYEAWLHWLDVQGNIRDYTVLSCYRRPCSCRLYEVVGVANAPGLYLYVRPHPLPKVLCLMPNLRITRECHHWTGRDQTGRSLIAKLAKPALHTLIESF